MGTEKVAVEAAAVVVEEGEEGVHDDRTATVDISHLETTAKTNTRERTLTRLRSPQTKTNLQGADRTEAHFQSALVEKSMLNALWASTQTPVPKQQPPSYNKPKQRARQ